MSVKHAKDVPTSGVLYEYRGKLYPEHSRDPDWVYERKLALDPGWRRDDFPESATFGDDPEDPWVRFGAKLIDARFLRTVRGRWRDCDVTVGRMAKAGPDRGLIGVGYAGTSPSEAAASGFIQLPNQYWSAMVDPADLEITDVTLERQPEV